jgi:hypothetical protein
MLAIVRRDQRPPNFARCQLATIANADRRLSNGVRVERFDYRGARLARLGRFTPPSDGDPRDSLNRDGI